MFTIVTAANTTRIPTTTNTIRLCSRATAIDPPMFTRVMATTTATAKTVAHAVESLVNGLAATAIQEGEERERHARRDVPEALAPRREKMPAPTIDATPMNAA